MFKHGDTLDRWGQFGQLQNFGGAILDTCSFKVRGLKLCGNMYYAYIIADLPPGPRPVFLLSQTLTMTKKPSNHSYYSFKRDLRYRVPRCQRKWVLALGWFELLIRVSIWSKYIPKLVITPSFNTITDHNLGPKSLLNITLMASNMILATSQSTQGVNRRVILITN